MISVIMPAYNSEKYVEDAINSVQKQTFQDWELILIDDGSTDGTADIVKKMQVTDNRIVYIYQQNKRLGAARNTGFRAAKGDWIAFLDSDDLWTDDKLEKQLEISKQHPEVDVIFTDGYIFFSHEPEKLLPYPTIAGKFQPNEMYKLEFSANHIPVLSVMAKKELINNIGFQEERNFFGGCEDWDFWLRMAQAGAVFYGMPEKLFYYRRHESNMSSNIVKMQVAQAALLIKNFNRSHFTKKEVREIFKPLMDQLTYSLFDLNKIEEARFLYGGLKSKVPIFQYKVHSILINLMGRFSFLPIKMVNKMERSLSRFKNLNAAI